MKKLTKFEDAYDSLVRVGTGSITEEAKSELKRAINGSTSLLVAKAAEIVGERGIQELIPDMISAFDRFMVNGAKTDKQCSAKIAIVSALNALDHQGDHVFLAASHYIQMEPVYGGQVDTAVELRSGCALALARVEHPEAHYVLTDLLADGEYPVRIAAVKALTYLGSIESELLLRLKVLTGDKEPNVIAECFAGLMAMTPDRSLGFVARYLHASEAIAESAALALGNSKLSGAYDILRQCWDDDISPTSRRRLLLPFALLRKTEAFDFLLEIIQSSDVQMATRAISALSIYFDEDSFRKIASVVKSRRNSEISDAFTREFGRSAD